MHILFYAFQALSSVVGIVIAAYVLFVSVLTKQMKTAGRLLLIQLSFTELMLSVVFLGCGMPDAMKTTPWHVSPGDGGVGGEDGVGCNPCGFLISFLRPVAVWTVCGLNCDRYYAISSPLHYDTAVNPKKICAAICAIWTCGFAFSLPLLATMVTRRAYNVIADACAPIFRDFDLSPCLSLFHFSLVFLLPLVMIIFFNYKIFMIARYHKHRIASAIFEVTLSAQVTITHQKNLFFPSAWTSQFKGRSALLAIVQLVGSFILVYGPYYALLISNSLEFVSSTNLSPTVPGWLTTAASLCMGCSSGVNGLVYGVNSKALKTSFQHYWRKRVTKTQIMQEIQARTPSNCGSRRPSYVALGGFFHGKFYRRPSEASESTQKTNLILNVNGGNGEVPYSNGHKYCGWRPTSTPGLVRNESYTELKRTRSFRNGIPYASVSSLVPYTSSGKARSRNAGIMSPTERSLMRVARRMEAYEKPRSPRILVTRAYSEEKKCPSPMGNHLPKQAASTTFLDATWHLSGECVAFELGKDESSGSSGEDSSSGGAGSGGGAGGSERGKLRHLSEVDEGVMDMVWPAEGRARTTRSKTSERLSEDTTGDDGVGIAVEEEGIIS